jgi:hypothetical protein
MSTAQMVRPYWAESLVYLVRPQARIEWVGFENRKRLARRSLLNF